MVAVTVMGAGVMGLSAAYVLARRGARVRVIERAWPGAGASGGVVGALAPHAPEQWNPMKQLQLESLLRAGWFWSEVARTGGVDPGYARLGRVQPLADEGAVTRARARGEAAQTLWQGRAIWQVLPVADVGGLDLISPTGLVALDTLSARLSPRQALAALTAALTALGVPIEKGQAPPGNAGQVVWATGNAGLAELSAAFGAKLGAPVKGQAALLKADWPKAPQIYAPGLHVVPHAEGVVAVGSTSETAFADALKVDAQLDVVIDRARAVCPALADAPVIERWAGLRPRARSRQPVLGAWPGREGHFVLNGGFKTGFGLAPGLAELLACLVLEGSDQRPPGLCVEDSLPKGAT